MILLIGIWISFTKNPMNPIKKKPMPTARAIWVNSKQKLTWVYQWEPCKIKLKGFLIRFLIYKVGLPSSATHNERECWQENSYLIIIPFWSGFLHLLSKATESLKNCFGASIISCMLSIFAKHFLFAFAKTGPLHFFTPRNENSFYCLNWPRPCRERISEPN